MVKIGKRHKSNREQIDKSRKYSVEDAVDLLGKFKPPKFDETVEVAIKLGVDVKKSDQIVRGAFSLPHGLGKTLRVIVFAKEERH